MMNKTFFRHGIGSGIIQYSLKKFFEMGYSKVRLAYMKENMQSKSFWEKCGFLETGIETENDQGNVVILEKELRE